jgi:NTP pyrophosphatase (non-canonical NTP hydrolase)
MEDKKWTYETFAEEAKRTRNPQLSFKDRLINNAFGLSGEVGEFVDLMKKVLFHGTDIPKEKIVKELGDIQYYWAETVSTLGEQLKFTVQDVLDTNSKKLRERYPNGFSFAAANERKDEKVEKVTNADGEKANLYKLYSALMDDIFGPRS